MAETTLYDAYGRLVRKQELTREHAAPSLAGIRRVWDDSVLSGLTPQRLATLLMEANQGDADAYLTLAEEMEERDPHYACELGKRKLAVSRLPVTVESFSDDKRDIELTDAVRAMVRRPGFRFLIKALMDGIGKGYSVAEIMWDRSGPLWQPGGYEWRDPRFFTTDRVSRRQIRLKDEADISEGIPLEPYKFIVHVPTLKMGIPIRNGIARLATVAYMCKNYTVKDWMAFAEIFGMPLRVGRYGPNATDDDIAILKIAVANLGSDAAAVLPESMKIEFQEAAKTSGSDSLFKSLADWFDAQISRAILGQTATTQGTPGKLGNEEAQKEVREDIRDDDAEQIEETINRDLVKAFIDLNFGPQENYPTVQLRATKPEDIATMSEALSKLVPLGLKVEQSEVRDRLGFADPEEGAELLGKAASPEPKPGEAAATNRAHGCACSGCDKARNRQGDGEDDAVDAVADEMLADWEPVMAPVIDPIRRAVDEATDLEDLKARLEEILSAQDAHALVQSLATGGLIARAMGDATDEV